MLTLMLLLAQSAAPLPAPLPAPRPISPAPPPYVPADAYAFVVADEDDGLLRGAIPLAPDYLGLKPADAPTGVLPEKKVFDVDAVVSVSAEGKPTACTETAVPLPVLKGITCRAIMARARFNPALDRQGKRVADTLSVRGNFMGPGVMVVPAPPMDAAYMEGGYGDSLIRANSQTLVMTAEPDWASFHPGKPGEAPVRMTAYRIQPDGSALYYCTPVKPRLDRPSWEAACKAVKAAQYRTNPAMKSNELFMLVRWLPDGKAQLVLAPDGKAGTTLRWASQTAQQVPGMPYDPQLRTRARLDFPVDGKTPRCRIVATSGDDAGDVAACRHLESLPYSSPVDVFGRKFAIQQVLRVVSATPPPPRSEPASVPPAQ